MPHTIYRHTLTVDLSAGWSYDCIFDDAPTLISGPEWATLTAADWGTISDVYMSFEFVGLTDPVPASGYVTKYLNPTTPETDTYSDSFSIILDSQHSFNLPVAYQTVHTNAEIVRDVFAYHFAIDPHAGSYTVNVYFFFDWIPTSGSGGVPGWVVGSIAMAGGSV